jgi:hypothetical protein
MCFICFREAKRVQYLRRSLSSSSGSRLAGIVPIAKVLKRDSVIVRFMPLAQQNDERSAERTETDD